MSDVTPDPSTQVSGASISGNDVSLADGSESFTITGGALVGSFEDGDITETTSGTVGMVDLKLDDSVFDTSGETETA
ncbi:hypothetical protein [Streptomyces sp. AP-93]|uniref:hypothetical protein n=1 Tax=Streptomyces sp. AP-93 TaxID=2929048 RepID=UPI001FAED226|nr:hypothetical protein [Streptomyces sp. AP-93]MCJ0872706.1 hypothetical protein [Streptomyces sp. AP-93]